MNGPTDLQNCRMKISAVLGIISSGRPSRKSRSESIRAWSLGRPPLTCYAAHSLEAALWAFYRSESFREGALLAVNLGDDADTTGAVYGQVAGVYYGHRGIPEGLREKIAKRKLIEGLAEKLYHSVWNFQGLSCGMTANSE